MRLNLTLQNIVFCVALLGVPIAGIAKPDPVLLKGVHVVVEAPRQAGSLFRWKITNSLGTAVFVYDFYLWGPALHVDTKADEVVVETAPVTEVRSCPPNRFPPVLLLVIAPGRTIEGDYTDSELKITGKKPVSLQIAVGTKPYQ